jgi:hypothetical protein
MRPQLSGSPVTSDHSARAHGAEDCRYVRGVLGERFVEVVRLSSSSAALGPPVAANERIRSNKKAMAVNC